MINVYDSMDQFLDEVEGKTFKSGDKCYQYNAVHTKCRFTKKTIDIHRKKIIIFVENYTIKHIYYCIVHGSHYCCVADYNPTNST